METLILTTNDSASTKLLIQLAEKLGGKGKKLSAKEIEELEDMLIIKGIEKGKKSGLGNKDKVLKKLGL